MKRLEVESGNHRIAKSLSAGRALAVRKGPVYLPDEYHARLCGGRSLCQLFRLPKGVLHIRKV
jgi:hypothetical protein